MTIEFQLPDLGENIESGDVVNVLVHEGDEIQANQPVLEIETDKALVEVPCPHAGKVLKLHVNAGDTLPVGGLILTLDSVAAGDNARPAAQKPQSAPRAAAPPASPSPAAPAPAKPAPQASQASDELDSDDGDEAEPQPKHASAVRVAPAATSSIATPSAPANDDHLQGMRDNAAAGPAVRRLARELGVDLARVTGTGPDGRILREDVITAVRQANVTASAAAATQTQTKARPKPAVPPGTVDKDNWGTIRRERLSKIRKTIATNMARSASTIPHVTNFDDADVTEIDRIRKESSADYVEPSVKLTMLPFVMKSIASSLKLHPTLNATLDTDNEQIIYKEYINLGVAVNTPRGLVVPVIRNVDRMSIPQIAEALAQLATQARANQFALEDLRGGSFTISNLGAVGGTYSTPIINHPEVAVLLVGRSRKQPVVINDKLEIRLMMPLSISYDHRLIDGATAARFLNDVIGFLEAPGRLLLAP